MSTDSSHPLEDEEERTGENIETGDSDASERAAILDAMPKGNAETQDQVAEEPSDPDISDRG